MRNVTASGLVADSLGLSVLLSLSTGNGGLKDNRLKIKEGEQRGFHSFVFLLQPHAVLALSCV